MQPLKQRKTPGCSVLLSSQSQSVSLRAPFLWPSQEQSNGKGYILVISETQIHILVSHRQSAMFCKSHISSYHKYTYK